MEFHIQDPTDKFSPTFQEVLLIASMDAYAGGGAFDQAIELLEMSTGQLVRAIRSAGIYIPG